MNRFLLSRYIKLLLTESKADDLKKKYTNIDVDFYSANDPSRKNKYLEWMVKQAAKEHTKEDIVATVSYFHENLFKFQSKDINFYKDLKDLEDEVKEASEKKSNIQQRQEVKSSGSEDIYEDDEVIVKYIKEKDACQLYGSGTKWCITTRDESYWEHYIGNNNVFYFILRKNPKQDKFDKVAVSVERDLNNNILDIKYWDSEDKNHTESKLSTLFKNFNKFFSLIKSHVLTVPKGILAKIQSKEASEKEIDQAIEMYKDDSKTLLFILKNADKIKPEKLIEFSRHENKFIRTAVARNPNTPPKILTRLSRDEYWEPRRRVAQNPNTPTEALVDLSKDKDEHVREVVARNPATPTEVLVELSRDEKWTVREAVAQNPNTSPETLTELSKDEHKHTRRSVARNPNTPPETLTELSKDEEWFIREAIAQNPFTYEDILMQLAKDDKIYVRRGVLRNHSVTDRVLNILSKDEDINSEEFDGVMSKRSNKYNVG